MESRTRIWVGAAIVVAGMLLLLRTADVFPFNTSFTTVLFLGAGGWLFYRRASARRWQSLFLPLVLIGLGLVISERLGLWPILIIALGAALILGSLRGRDASPP
jgi:ABC-type uncharacterized transport system permease subunit